MTTNLIFVITATTGKETLLDTIESVQKQTYEHIKHIIVCDGYIHQQNTEQLIEKYKSTSSTVKDIELITIPWQTGKDNWVCHRIYAAIPHLIVEDAYISFLDEDNYVDSDHYSSLYNTITSTGNDWAYSLRKIITREKEFVAYDMCESLGYLAYVWVVAYQLNTNPEIRAKFQENPSYFLVDTNCYLIKKEVIQKISHNWQRPARQQPEADRLIFYELWKKYKGICNMKYTLNYRLDGRRGDANDSAIGEFYIKGNEYMNQIYSNYIPWKP
jgi:glycosyltransferase involved in cell wall biosynthesis